MKFKLIGFFLFFFFFHETILAQKPDEMVRDALLELKQGKTQSARDRIEKLSPIDSSDLAEALNSPQTAKAFWVNLYNAIVQVLLIEDPSRYEDRGKFFTKEWFTVAGESLSLDDIEHGIIRGSKHKYTLGYTEKLFVNDFEETFRLDVLDYRVHFALNCGAKSCPPVAIYVPDRLDAQLDQSAKEYLNREVKNDAEAIYIPKLCQWFYADFGGEKGISNMLDKYLEKGRRPEDTNFEYLEYDWTLLTGNFVNW